MYCSRALVFETNIPCDRTFSTGKVRQILSTQVLSHNIQVSKKNHIASADPVIDVREGAKVFETGGLGASLIDPPQELPGALPPGPPQASEF
jgi:hypothetical protein